MNTFNLSSQGFFVTGTDTGIGKTTISCLLLDLFAQQGRSTLGVKPIATGCYPTQEGNRSEDAQSLQEYSTLKLPYAHINPIAMIPPTSPNIAAGNQMLSVHGILDACQPALTAQVDFLIIEGAGGWKVPINKQETMADLAAVFKLPILLVVGIRLGCINHALLTIESIQNSNLPLCGWIANEIEPGNCFLTENQNTIAAQVNIPLLGTVPFRKTQKILNLLPPFSTYLKAPC